MKLLFPFLLCLLLINCQSPASPEEALQSTPNKNFSPISLVLLGNLQDAGAPHIGCIKDCCQALFEQGKTANSVISLGLFDASNQKQYLLEATPDIANQLYNFNTLMNRPSGKMPDGIFLTHAHIGHYSGLMYLGKEAKGAESVKVYAMPRMRNFLKNNGPWSQLEISNNIQLLPIQNDSTIVLSQALKIIPFLVPHRDEYSETVGYKIIGPNKSALFIPDIDKWDNWNKDIVDEIKQVDYAFLDATFYSGKEINHRDISQIPHPFIIESLLKFKMLSDEERAKVIFIHFNHTNPVLNLNSTEAQMVRDAGFKLGITDQVFRL